MLLFYLKYLKIIIFIINIILYNWGETRPGIVIKNNIFIINLLCLLKGKRIKLKNIIEFTCYRRVRYYK